MRKDKYLAYRSAGSIRLQFDRALEGAGGGAYAQVLTALASDHGAVDALERLRLERIDAARISRWDRYLDVARYLKRAVGVVKQLPLGQGGGASLVDIGSGPCYLGYAAGVLHGAVSVGLDLPEEESPVRWRIASILGQDLRAFRLEPAKPLPDLGRTFDVATILAPQFYRKAGDEFWTEAEWLALFHDILDRYVSPGGTLFMMLNPRKRRGDGVHDHAEVYSAAEKIPGSRVSGRTFWLPRP